MEFVQSDQLSAAPTPIEVVDTKSPVIIAQAEVAMTAGQLIEQAEVNGDTLRIEGFDIVQRPLPQGVIALRNAIAKAQS